MSEHRHPISLFGFLAGLVSGLFIAVVIALYLTHAPVPFVSKVQHATDVLSPDAADPNRSLFSPQIPTASGAGAASQGTPPKPAEAGETPPAAAAAPGAAPAGADGEAAGNGGAAPAAGAVENGEHVVLQVGAFQSADDADAVRARLALLGLDAKVSATQAEGNSLYRVRLGPYGPQDDLNGIRRTLSENGLEPQIVHLR